MKAVCIAILPIFALIFSACSLMPGFSEKPAPKPIITAPKSEFIKGTINSVAQQDGDFLYVIYAKQNGSVRAFKALSAEGGFDIGDLVYAQIQDGRIVYMSVLAKDYLKILPKPKEPEKAEK